MEKDRWKQLSSLFDAALKLEAKDRVPFLQHECAGDEALLSDVTKLLSGHAHADNGKAFFEQNAVEMAAPLLVADENIIGTTVGRYKIEKRIDAGGMGEVFLAEDSTLGRKAAIKLLLSEVAADRERIDRFTQEARAASALNHPNIITVYEIGDLDGRPFIATEFIKGETLRSRLKQGAQGLRDAIDIAIQLSSALSAAHEANIIHRDIKPENIMVRDDGLVKVLDFGLAKLSSHVETASAGSNVETLKLGITTPGMILGTVSYMSPEQARGKDLDARTDIWSLGVVLYEMVAGRAPFAGETAADTLVSIVDKQPPPLPDEIPPKLARIVLKALSKNKDERYRTSRELRADLEQLKRTIETGAFAARPDDETVVLDAPNTAERPTNKTEAIWNRRSSIYAAAAALLLLILGSASFWVWRSRVGASSAPTIKSLAVLPFKSADANQNYLGLGIADAVIRRMNQTGELIVRPTSAVRRYLTDDTDALTAAQQLNADAVLEGTLQQSGDRIRVTFNLMRASDGRSLGTDQYDMRAADNFTIQDNVAQKLASLLELRLDAKQQAQLTKRYTSNPKAYELYLRAIFNFGQRLSQTKKDAETTVELFKQAIAADPDFALAHAQLAYADAIMAVFNDPTVPSWAQQARDEIDAADRLDPELADTHLARYQLLYSQYGNWDLESAMRELKLAQQIDSNVGHAELEYLYLHSGLEDLADREIDLALELDPTSELDKQAKLATYEITGQPEGWLPTFEKYYPGQPVTNVWYLTRTGQLDEALKQIEATQNAEAKGVTFALRTASIPNQLALISALKGDFRAAEDKVPEILAKHPTKDPGYHHATYDIACIYALEGKSEEAVKWLRETAASGYFEYGMFQRDPYLDGIRQSKEFVQFMAEGKATYEKYRAEFAG